MKIHERRVIALESFFEFKVSSFVIVHIYNCIRGIAGGVLHKRNPTMTGAKIINYIIWGLIFIPMWYLGSSITTDWISRERIKNHQVGATDWEVAYPVELLLTLVVATILTNTIACVLYLLRYTHLPCNRKSHGVFFSRSLHIRLCDRKDQQ